MTSRLLATMRHLHPDCRSATARVFRGEYLAFETRLGPFDDVAHKYAVGAVLMWMRYQDAARLLKLSQDARDRGRGRFDLAPRRSSA